MKFAVKKIFLFLILVWACTIAVFAQDFLPELVRRIKPSAVAIETFDAKGATLSRGSGFFVSGDKGRSDGGRAPRRPRRRAA